MKARCSRSPNEFNTVLGRAGRLNGVSLLLFVAGGLLATSMAMHGCATPERGGPGAATTRATNPLAVGLGNLRIGKTPTASEVRLAQFLFGVEPDAGLFLLKPMDLGAGGGRLVICEGAMQRVLRWTPDGEMLLDEPLNDAPRATGAVTIAPNGDLLLAAGGVAQRFRGGALLAEYRLPGNGDGSQRIGGIACTTDQVWLTNVLAHRVEVFDAESGKHLRSIGKRGEKNAEFGLPLGIAAVETEVFVVDMLNARVQVFDRDGNWTRNIGGPGDRLGYFGRPRTIAIGPDATVFVTDAALQRITAFTLAGQPLTTFGGPNDFDALVLPAGIAIWTDRITATRTAPADFAVSYYVLVSEQISRPGVRAFAWRSPGEGDFIRSRRSSAALTPGIANPHFDKTQCGACHVLRDGQAAPIAAQETDALCLSCHDGRQAVAEAHPIARISETAQTRTPVGWPTIDGRIGCLTCHDIRRHCDNPVRPVSNAALVRGYDPLTPLASCRQCHVTESWRANPHRGAVAGANSPTASCGFCHVRGSGMNESESVTEFADDLRDAPTKLCLNCHTMHADPAPQGHLDKLVPDVILNAMKREGGSASTTLLPLAGDAVTCATCHNPHPAGAEYAALFKSPAAKMRSSDPADAHKSLRMPHVELCLHCHPR